MNRIDNAAYLKSLENEVNKTGLRVIGSIKSLDNFPKSASARLSIGMECLDRELWDYKPTLNELENLGIKRTRLQSGWALTEQAKGTYDFTWLDNIIDDLLQLGISPWLTLCYGNPLYADPNTELRAGGIGHVPLNTEESKIAWSNYVEAVVKRYQGKVDHFEIWNEPDCSVFFPCGNKWPEKYVELVKISYEAIKKANPDAKIIACSAAGTGLSCGNAEKVLKLGLGDYIDIFAYHGYRELPEQNNRQSRLAHKKLFEKYAPHVKIWLGESGCPSYNAPTSFGALSKANVSEENQAQWLSRRVILDLEDPNLELISYFHLYDFMHFTKQHNYYYGILREGDFTHKPSFDILQFISFFLDQNTEPDDSIYMELWPLPDSQSNLSKSQVLNCHWSGFLHKNKPIYTYWYPEEIGKQFTPTTIQFGYWPGSSTKFKQPIIIDILTRKIYQPEVDDGGRIAKAPLASYPLLFTDFETIKDYAIQTQEPAITEKAENSKQMQGG